MSTERASLLPRLVEAASPEMVATWHAHYRDSAALLRRRPDLMEMRGSTELLAYHDQAVVLCQQRMLRDHRASTESGGFSEDDIAHQMRHTGSSRERAVRQLIRAD